MQSEIPSTQSIQSISVDEIPYWIANGIWKHTHFEEFTENVRKMKVKNIFPNFRKIKQMAENALNKIDGKMCRECVYKVDIEHDGKSLGTVESGPNWCYLLPTVRSIKDDLSQKTVKLMANEVGEHIANEIETDIAKELQAIFGMELRYLSKMISKCTFQQEIKSISKSITVNLFDNKFKNLILILLELLLQIFSPVDINSKNWRNDIADEIFEIFLKERDSLCERLFNDVKNIDKALDVLKEGIVDFQEGLDQTAEVFKRTGFRYEEYTGV